MKKTMRVIGIIKKIIKTGMPAFAGVLFFLFLGMAAECASNNDSTPLTNLLPGWPQMLAINEASGVVMDADNGGVMYSLNRDTVRYPASTTKILTALIAIENADSKDIVTMTESGIAYVADGSTNAGTSIGEEFTVEQCLYMILLKSANDVATSLAEHVAGSVSAFADMMNARAAELGCTSTHFTNPSGMPDSDHYTTAYDMALIMRECLKNEYFRDIIATPVYTVPPTNKTAQERVYENHCKLIMPSSDVYYEPCIGGKTGFTQAAWRTLVTAAEKDGRTLICVLMRGPNNTDFTDAKNLFEYAFRNFEVTELDGVPVNLPSGFDTSILTKEVTEGGDGYDTVTWKYNKLPVGSARVPHPGAEASSQVSQGDGDDEAGAANGREREHGGISKVSLILLTVFLGVFALSLYIFLTAGGRSGGGRRRSRRRR